MDTTTRLTEIIKAAGALLDTYGDPHNVLTAEQRELLTPDAVGEILEALYSTPAERPEPKEAAPVALDRLTPGGVLMVGPFGYC